VLAEVDLEGRLLLLLARSIFEGVLIKLLRHFDLK
jgi:hypothetical protein